MRCIQTVCISLLACLLVTGCAKTHDKEDGNQAPGERKGEKEITFEYDPRAPEEWLRITKSRGEGAHVDVYIGKMKTGTLNFGTIVQKIGDEKGWYKIRYSNNDAEFFGYIRYSDAVSAEKHRESEVILVGEEAEPGMYTMQQVEEKLNEILRVPYKLEVIEQYPEVKTKKVFASAGTIDGYGELKLLKKFHNEPQAHVYINEMYSELGRLYPRSPENYRQVIDLYGQALNNFKAKKMRFFEDYLEKAEQKRSYFRRSF